MKLKTDWETLAIQVWNALKPVIIGAVGGGIVSFSASGCSSLTPDAPLTEEHPVHARIITGRKLKIDRTQYTFRNVEADGDEQPSTGDAAQPADGE